MQRKQNNAGFSLVEVVLSMAILAIISIPLLSYFMDSMKYNAKMADKQHATTLAQEVLEDLKNQDQLVGLDPTGSYYTVQYLLDNHYLADSSTFDAKGIGVAEFYGAADSIGQKYDVMVKVNTGTTENATPVTQVGSIDDTCDVMAVEGGQCQEALVHFKALNAAYAADHPGTGLTADQIKSKMVRTMEVNIQADGTYYVVKVNCSYSCKDLQGTGSTDSYTCTTMAENRLKDIRRVYLLFRATQKDDKVEVTLGSGVIKKPELYLICQTDALSVPTGYQVWVKKDIAIPIYTNIGKSGYPGGVADEYGAPLTNTEGLLKKEEEIRKIDIEVRIYKKGKAKTPGEEPYITVNTAKGE